MSTDYEVGKSYRMRTPDGEKDLEYRPEYDSVIGWVDPETGLYYGYPDVTPAMVDHPSHYQTDNGLEVIDVIEAYGLGFHRGNALKYILRAGKKDEYTQELEKARWYLDREIERVKNA